MKSRKILAGLLCFLILFIFPVSGENVCREEQIAEIIHSRYAINTFVQKMLEEGQLTEGELDKLEQSLVTKEYQRSYLAILYLEDAACFPNQSMESADIQTLRKYRTGDEIYELELLMDYESGVKTAQATMDMSIAPMYMDTDGHVWTNEIPLFKQTEDWNCGAAAALQALYGMGPIPPRKVNGSTYADKVNQLTKDCGSNEEVGTYVYRVAQGINKYSAGYGSYQYLKANSVTYEEFKRKCRNSLAATCPVILHADTSQFSYYNGHSTGHYICLYDIRDDWAIVIDCHPNSAYYGRHSVRLQEAYNAVKNGRYFIFVG